LLHPFQPAFIGVLRCPQLFGQLLLAGSQPRRLQLKVELFGKALLQRGDGRFKADNPAQRLLNRERPFRQHGVLRGALDQLDLPQFDLLIVENVGNLVCPANFKLGTHKTVLIASIPEGDDKPYKYPGAYRGVDALVINKIDLLPYVPFRMDYFQRGVQALNPDVTTFPLSCVTGEGLDAWINWLTQHATRYTLHTAHK